MKRANVFGWAACVAACAGLLLAGCGQPADDAAPDGNGTAEEMAAEAGTSPQTEAIGETAETAPAATESDIDVPEEEPVIRNVPAGAEQVAAAEAPAAVVGGGVNVSGLVAFNGTPPSRKPINMEKEPKCIELHGGMQVLDEDVIVSDAGQVKNVFVYVRTGAPKADYPVPEEPVVLSQQGCMYRPRVQGVMVGQQFLVSNADPLTHNVRSFPVRNRAFNFGQPADSEPRERIFKRPEREVEVQCDFHRWMHAYIFVMDHPFWAVTGDDGAFTIAGLPPGEYTLAAWHEKFGEQRQKITVADADVNLNFTYAADGD